MVTSDHRCAAARQEDTMLNVTGFILLGTEPGRSVDNEFGLPHRLQREWCTDQ